MFQRNHSERPGRMRRLAGIGICRAILLIGLSGLPDLESVQTSRGHWASTAEIRPAPRRSARATSRPTTSAFAPNPKDADAALKYARALRATGQRAQAVAVLEQAVLAQPSNKALLAGYGRALADNGNFQQAFDVRWPRAYARKIRTGASCRHRAPVLDQLDRHDEARQYYASALKIVPEEPSVLSNLRPVLSAVEGSAARREETLRRAPRRARRAMRACGPIWPSWSACRAAGRRPRPS